MTDQIDAFTGALQTHLQPLLDRFMNLEVWARICIGDLEGDDEQIRETLTDQLPGCHAIGSTTTRSGGNYTRWPTNWPPFCAASKCPRKWLTGR